MTAAGFTLAGADHAIIPVMLGEAVVAQNFARELQKRRDLCHRLLLSGGTERPGAYSHPDVGGAYPLNKLSVRWKPLPASANNWASSPNKGMR